MFKIIVLIVVLFYVGVLSLNPDKTVTVHTDTAKSLVSDLASHIKVEK